MSDTFTPTGLFPVKHKSGDVIPQFLDGLIASGYATSIYYGQPIMVDRTAFQIYPVTATNQAWDGVFLGCEYTRASDGVRVPSTSWPAGTLIRSGTTVRATVVFSEGTIYEIQANGSIANADVMKECNFAGFTDAATNGMSHACITTPITTTEQGQVRILEISGSNPAGDTYTKVYVENARPLTAVPVPAKS